MTNTQFAKLAEALALIHGELVAIRKSCEAASARVATDDVTPANAFAVLTAPDSVMPAAVAEAFEAEAREVRAAAPGAQRKRESRGKRGGR